MGRVDDGLVDLALPRPVHPHGHEEDVGHARQLSHHLVHLLRFDGPVVAEVDDHDATEAPLGVQVVHDVDALVELPADARVDEAVGAQTVVQGGGGPDHDGIADGGHGHGRGRRPGHGGSGRGCGSGGPGRGGPRRRTGRR